MNTPIKFTSKEVVSIAQLNVYGIPGRDYFGCGTFFVSKREYVQQT